LVWSPVASGKLGKGGGDVGSNFETFRWNPVGKPIPPGRAWPATGSESCVVREQSRLRSVDSEYLGPAIEPRKKTTSWEPSSSVERGPCHTSVWPAECGPAGVQEQGISTQGFPRNLRDPAFSHGNSRLDGATGTQTPGPAWGLNHAGSEKPSEPVVSPSEGNEVRRKGLREVGVPHSTAEAGEPVPRGACGGKGVPPHGLVGGLHGEGLEPRLGVTATPATSTAAGEAVRRRAGCGKSARPDLREPWVGNHPGSPGGHKVNSLGAEHRS
jgi:hypothetical protein